MKNKNGEWQKDYEQFLNSKPEQVPIEVTALTFLKLDNLLNPNAWTVFFKILIVHLVSGFFSLAICHQFGLNPFNTEYSLADWFMSMGGHHFCMVACGLLFVGGGIFAAGYFLSVEEVKALKRTELLQNLTLGLISIGLFTAFGVEFVLSFAGLWLLGAMIGGLVGTNVLARVKLVNW